MRPAGRKGVTGSATGNAEGNTMAQPLGHVDGPFFPVRLLWLFRLFGFFLFQADLIFPDKRTDFGIVIVLAVERVV